MGFKERLVMLRKENHLTQEEFAKKIGYTRTAISAWEIGRNEPSNSDTVKIADFFNVSTDFLLGKSNYRYKGDLGYEQMLYTEVFDSYRQEFSTLKLTPYEQNIYNYIVSDFPLNKFTDKIDEQKICDYINSNYLKDKKDISSSSKNKIMKKVLLFIAYSEDINEFSKTINNNQYYMCPVYGEISAGQPNWAEENIEGRIPIDPNLMNIINPEEYYFLRVNGESMNKIIKNGAFALIHKQDFVDDGDIAVVLVNGYNATLKKFIKQDNFIILEPQSNDESFKSQVYDKTTSIKIIGKYAGKMELN